MRLVVARVGRPHGVHGEVTVEVRTDVPEQRFVPGTVFQVARPRRSPARGGVGARGRPGDERPRPLEPSSPSLSLKLAGVRDHNGVLLLCFDGVTDRTAAEFLRGVLLEVELTDTAEEPGAWYDHQLVGLRVEAPDGADLGRVTAVEHPGAQDLLVVRRPDGAERLVPFVTALVPTVDVDAGRLVVVDPGGLLTDVDEP